MDNNVQLPKPKLVSTTPHMWREHAGTKIISNKNTSVTVKIPNLFTNLEVLCHNKANLTRAQDISIIIFEEPSIDFLSSNKNDILEIFKFINVTILSENAKNTLQAILPELFTRIKNIIILDSVHEHFQYLGSAWNRTIDDAIVIYSIIHQYKLLRAVFDFAIENIDANRQDFMKRNGIQILSHNPEPESFWLFTQYYVPKQKERQEEILETLRKNLANTLIDKIILFIENESDIGHLHSQGLDLANVKIISHNKRLSYADFFKYVSSDDVPADTIVALANSDIYFDMTLLNIWTLDLKEKCLALLRWEHSEEGTDKAKILGPRPDSQDTWIFHAHSIKSHSKTKWAEKNYETFNYFLGTPGCDNSFTTDMIREKFCVYNPTASIKTYHIHASNIRTYTKKDLVYRPVYFGIHPTYISEKNNEKNIPGKPYSVSPYSCEINLKSNTDARVATYVTMLARGKRYVWNPPGAAPGTATVQNGFSKQWKIWEFSGDNFSSPYGLVSNYNNLLLGDNGAENFWSKSRVNMFNLTIERLSFLAIPVEKPSTFTNLSAFMIHYVGPLLRTLQEIYKNPNHPDKLSFFWPQEFFDLAHVFKFPLQCELVPWSHNINIYSKNMFMVPGGYTEVCQETIQALRSSLLQPLPDKPPKKIIILTSSAEQAVLSPDFADSIFAFISKLGGGGEGGEENGWSCEIYDHTNPPSYKVFQRAGGIIFWGDANMSQRWENLWALPPGSAMLEFQNEFKLDGEAQQMGAACGLDTRIFILQKADQKYLQGVAMDYIRQYFIQRQATEQAAD
jgi:hypothetical protein